MAKITKVEKVQTTEAASDYVFVSKSAKEAKSLIAMLDKLKIAYDFEVEPKTLDFTIALHNLSVAELTLIKDSGVDEFFAGVQSGMKNATHKVSHITVGAAKTVAPIITNTVGTLATTVIKVAAVFANATVVSYQRAKKDLNSSQNVQQCTEHFKE